MRKPRSDAILLNLPEEQQAKLADWLLSGLPYHEAKVLVEKEFGKQVKSLSGFAEFFQCVCAPAMLERRRRAAGTAEERAEEAMRNPARFDLATLDAVRQKAFELTENPEAKPSEVKAMLSILLKARDQELQERQLTLESDKFKESLRTKLQAGLDAVAEAFKGHAEAMQFYAQARALVAKETA